MKKAIVYAVVIIGCIAFCYFFSNIGIQAEGKGNVNPWVFTLGVLAVAVIMAIVHKIAQKQEGQQEEETPDEGEEKE